MNPITDSDPCPQSNLGQLWSWLKRRIGQRHGKFELRPDGVYYSDEPEDTDDGDEEKETETPQFVCSWLEVTAQSRDEHGQEWGNVLRWKDPDRRMHTWSAPRSLLVKNGTELLEVLAKGGLKIALAKQVKWYINAVNPSARILNVPRPGWYATNHRRVFVLPDQVVGVKDGEDGLILQADSYDPAARVVAGGLMDWQTKVAALCAGNHLLTFATSVAFASPTLELLRKGSGGFHLHGLTSLGKSTALGVAASVWGYPIETWRTTDNALEDTAERHNDVLLSLDEFSQVDPRKAAEVAYMLGNGEGKQRLTQLIVPQRKKQWRLVFLSTGEITLADHAEAGGVRTKAGTEVRMINLAADAGEGKGLFEDIHGAESPARFADLLKKNAVAYRGTAGPAFVECVIRNEGAVIKDLHELIQQFIATEVPKDAGGEIYRVGEWFAMVGAAGEIATKAGITGWKSGDAREAARWCFQRWMGNRSVGSSDMEKAVAQIRAFLHANQHRFEDFESTDNKNRAVINRAGFRKAVGDGDVEYLVTPELFKTELCQGYDVKAVVQELKHRGYLSKGTLRVTVQHRVPSMGNRPVWFYAIQSAVLGEEDKGAVHEPVSLIK
jgi:putative DNA primase/helicase